MLAFIERARLVLGLLPVIIDAIKSLEDAIPGEGRGEQKLAALRAVLEAVAESLGDAVETLDDIWPTIQSVVGRLVSLFNAIGWR